LFLLLVFLSVSVCHTNWFVWIEIADGLLVKCWYSFLAFVVLWKAMRFVLLYVCIWWLNISSNYKYETEKSLYVWYHSNSIVKMHLPWHFQSDRWRYLKFEEYDNMFVFKSYYKCRWNKWCNKKKVSLSISFSQTYFGNMIAYLFFSIKRKNSRWKFKVRSSCFKMNGFVRTFCSWKMIYCKLALTLYWIAIDYLLVCLHFKSCCLL